MLFHQVKPTDRPDSMSCVALLSPTGKSVSLQSATLCQCSQAKSAYCRLLTQVLEGFTPTVICVLLIMLSSMSAKI